MSFSGPSRAAPGGKDRGSRILPLPLKATAAVVLLCLAAAVGAFAGGGVERSTRERLKEAEALIEERRYNDAILLLTRIVKEDPEAFDAAERLMQRIRGVRDVYNETYQELLTALFEENDLGRALELIRELQAMDPNPTEATAKALDQARAATELVYNLNRFREIMTAARALLDRGQYRQAVDKYLEGFALGRETFQRAGYGNIVTGAVGGALDRLQAAVPRFFEGSEALGREIGLLEGEISGLPPDGFAERSQVIRGLLEETGGQLATVGRSGSVFESQNAQVMDAIREGKPDLFLFLATRLVHGREEEPPEGILFAMQAVWNERYGAAERSVSGPADAALARGLEGYRSGDFEATRAAFGQAGPYYRSSLELQSLWPLAVRPGRSLEGAEDTVRALRAELPEYFLTQLKLEEMRDTEALIGIVTRLSALEARTVDSPAEIEAAAREIGPLRDALRPFTTSWREKLERYRALTAEGLAVGAAIDRTDAVLARFLRAGDRVSALETSYLGTLAMLRGTDLERRFEGLPERLAQGVASQEGREVQLEPVRDEAGNVVETPVRIEKFPREALEVYEPLERSVSQLLGETRDIIAAAGASQEYLDKNPEVAAQVRKLRNLEERLGTLESELTERLPAARQDAIQAESYRREGLDNLEEARRSLRNRAYGEAQERVQRAQEAFDVSLALQEDRTVRRIRDEELPDLLAEIEEGLTQLVVREVRQLIEQGKSLYRQGDFNRAEQSLLVAQRRWTQTLREENPEITLWLGFVRAAVSASTGREIPLTDPLYPEMSQLYNQALGEFQEGRRLLAEGSDRLAVERFNRAQEKLTQILKFFPYNQDARLLGLRIDQVRDPDAFRRQLDTLFREALAKVPTNPLEAYATLKDIQSLQPSYPGLERGLYNVEVELGIRLPPVDPGRLAEARAQYESANAIWRQRRVADYPLALEYVNRAIAANPDFREAITLKDNLQVAQGAPSSILSSDDQRKLRQAEEEFLKGNDIIALAIVEDLLRKPQYRNLQQLVELKRRIESRL